MITLTENTKRILFIAFFMIFSLATGYALYYFFFKPAVPVPSEVATQGFGGVLGESGPRGPVETASTEQGELPEAVTTEEGTEEAATAAAGTSDVTLIRDSVTQAISPDSKGELRYYNPTDGRFYRINADGTMTLLSDRQFFDVQSISWSNVANEAIMEFPDGNNIYYGFDDQRQVELPKHWTDFQFAPKQDEITAKSMGLDEGNRFLVTAKPDGNEATAIYNLGANADLVIPSWSPNNQVVAFSKTGAAQPDNAERIYLLGPNHENYNAITVPGRGFVPNWSTTGKRLLYSVYHERDDFKPMLWVTDANGQNIGNNRQKLNLETWADKCVWGSDSTLICAVPIALPTGAGYDRTQSSSIPDDIYYINLETGISRKINSSEQNYTVNQPSLNSDQTKLTFTDALTGKLYSYNLNY